MNQSPRKNRGLWISLAILLTFFGMLGKSLAEDKKTQVIVFDVGGVLAKDLLNPVLEDLAKNNSVDIEKMKAAKNEFRSWADRGILTDLEFWQKVLTESGVDPELQVLPKNTQKHIHYLAQFVVCNTAVLEVARMLKEKGYKIAILSNDSFEMSMARRGVCGFDDVFRKKNIYISAFIASLHHNDEELIKPNPGVYEYTIAALRTEASNIYFIDDNPKNIEGAEKAGIHGIEFKAAGDSVVLENAQSEDKQALIDLLHAKGIEF